MKELKARKLGRYARMVAVLMGIWLLLSGRLYAQHVLIGLGGSVLIALAMFRWDVQRPFPVMRFLAFLPWHLWQVLISNLRVVRITMLRRSSIEPQLIRVKPNLDDEGALAVLGCAITLTPGTLTVEIDSHTMLVHALDATSASEIERGVMAERVGEVFEQA